MERVPGLPGRAASYCDYAERSCPRVLRGDVDPLNSSSRKAVSATAEHLYQDSPTLRLINLLRAEGASARSFDGCQKGERLRILEVGGGTGGTTGFILPVLPEHCTEYVFTDVSARFTAQAQHKFAHYPFAQCRTLDIERDPLEQGFDPHSFDLIIASGGLHATKDLRKTLDHVKQLLGSGGTLAIAEPTHPWLNITLIFGLLKGWWLFDDDVRRDEPCISQESWSSLLHDAGFSDVGLRRRLPGGIERPALGHPRARAATDRHRRRWRRMSTATAGRKPGCCSPIPGLRRRARAGAELALRLRQRGDTVFEVACRRALRASRRCTIQHPRRRPRGHETR